jgi:amidase
MTQPSDASEGSLRAHGDMLGATQLDYYPRALSLTSVAGIGRLPQVSLPLAESSGGIPVGLSLLAANGRDAFLLSVTKKVAAFMKA